MRVAVVDYGAGNLVSIEQALTSVGARVSIARDGRDLEGADALIVPGVGAAAPAMTRLARFGMLEPIRGWLADDRPFLGICLGLQLLFESSDEDGAETLGVLPGRTRRLANAPTLPHIGWNQAELRRAHRAFEGLGAAPDMYFVHSYAADTEDDVVDLVRVEVGVALRQLLQQAGQQRDRLDLVQRAGVLATAARSADGVVDECFGHAKDLRKLVLGMSPRMGCSPEYDTCLNSVHTGSGRPSQTPRLASMRQTH